MPTGVSVATNCAGGSTSRKTPVESYSCPSSERMPMTRLPPTRRSISHRYVVMCAGPYQRMNISGSVQARQTSSRGASKTRSIRTCVEALVAWVLGPAVIARLLQFGQICVESIESLLPEPAVVLDPVGDLLQGLGREPARPPLMVR